MKSNNLTERKSLPIQVYGVYALLILPISVILLINKLLSPLSPSISFSDLDNIR